MRLGDDQLEIVAHQGFSARQTALHGTQLTPLRQHAEPVLGREFVFLPRVVDRVVAKHAVQRATVGQLGQQPQRWPGRRGTAGGCELKVVGGAH